MLTGFKYVRRIGKFFEATSGANLPLSRLSLIYAENGRGKTTIAAILRSLRTGQPDGVLERRRLGDSAEPTVVVQATTGTATFQGGKWSTSNPRIAIFDDEFVAANIHAGMEVGSDHRQHLHELIIGEEGVRLNETLLAAIAENESLNRALGKRSELIPPRLRGNLSPEAFCDLPPIPNLEAAVEQTNRSLAAARESFSVTRHVAIQPLVLPLFNVRELRETLGISLASIEQSSMTKVLAHVRALGPGGETWLADGGNRAHHLAAKLGEVCPYCAQSLTGSDIVTHYREYFGESYRSLRGEIERVGKAVALQHSGDAMVQFEKEVRLSAEGRDYWSRFAEIPPLAFDMEAAMAAWKAASAPVIEVLRRKYGAPLDPIELDKETLDAISTYHRYVERLEELMVETRRLNAEVSIVKERAAASNPAILEQDAARLKVVVARYSAEGRAAAERYNEERLAKQAAEAKREAARTALEQYRDKVFPAYQDRINHYLQRLNASFRLDKVVPTNHRSGSSATYHVLIDAIDVPVPLTPQEPNGPSVRTTLSAGDRSTLALAFFLSSLDLKSDSAAWTAVFDDPMTSLDLHRTSATVDEVLALSARIAQVIVLSHSMPFLCELWGRARENSSKSSLQLVRDKGNTTTFASWDVSRDMVTDHDKRAELVLTYLDDPVGIDKRKVAEALRFMLEATLRVSFPEWFPPGTNLGDFRSKCLNVVGGPQEKLPKGELDELGQLTNYANRFHHDSNPSGYSTAVVNDTELRNFAERTIRFMRRRF